ncbi:SulP family inorganic anion transporter [Vagococcus sp. BWB3-3]|uniref:SulP family inorganic anion transporter n=1 Tax=Vagococcus allomyrinae TaxID=2794353 RepID=A0A940SR15_9ENTE|nr:SulP family inorganic anion transporter [Vagococcus allomyrinae]MBP1040302.1 SulP family inorganic anion transporter [Vagococcus allomyrinae]
MLSKVKGYKKEYLINDLLSGITVAALSIPVAMGYAQIAGLQPIYGLYVSVLPVIVYALFASSPQLIFGVDSSSAAIAGSLVVAVGLTAGSAEALTFISTIALFTGLFMMVFAVMKLGKLTVYVSDPVMSGAIFGISTSVMLSQIPKILGISSEGSELRETITAIITQFSQINKTALVVGGVSIAFILIGKKFSTKIPFPIIVLIMATISSSLLKLDDYGVKVVGEIPQGLPPINVPQIFSGGKLPYAILGGLLSAIVLMTDSLLTSKSFANKNGYQLQENKELFAFGASNVMSAFSGVLPTSASVSRTAANEQFKGKTQLVSLIAAGIITLVLLFFSSLLFYMPQPALSGIVFSALFGVLSAELQTLKRVTKRSQKEGIIWGVSMLVVLLFGILVGIIVGVILSFILIIVTKSANSSAFLGKIPDETDSYFYDIKRNPLAKSVTGTLIYRYSNSLFFTNIDEFTLEIKREIQPETKKIIVDAHAISSIDTTAADKLKEFLQELTKDGIDYYFASTIGDFRDAVKKKGLTAEINEQHIVKNIEDALTK